MYEQVLDEHIYYQSDQVYYNALLSNSPGFDREMKPLTPTFLMVRFLEPLRCSKYTQISF